MRTQVVIVDVSSRDEVDIVQPLVQLLPTVSIAGHGSHVRGRIHVCHVGHHHVTWLIRVKTALGPVRLFTVQRMDWDLECGLGLCLLRPVSQHITDGPTIQFVLGDLGQTVEGESY